MISSCKAAPEIRTLIEKIKNDRKKRAEAKARRMLLRRPKRLTKLTASWSELLESVLANN